MSSKGHGRDNRDFIISLFGKAGPETTTRDLREQSLDRMKIEVACETMCIFNDFAMQ